MISQCPVFTDPLNPVSDEFLENPYPKFAEMRAKSPIIWSKKGKYWLVSSYEIASEITKDLHFEKRLERWNQISPIARILPGPAKLIKNRQSWMLNQNPPEHTHLRSLVNKAFSPKMIKGMQAHIQSIADRLIDKVAASGKIEFISEYAFLLPITVIAEMLGIPSQDHDNFKEWSHAITQTVDPGYGRDLLNKANDANDKLKNYLRPLLNERRRNPQEDLITALLFAEENGEKLSEEDVLGNIILMLVAGHETTVNLIGNGILALLRHPEQLKLLQNDPSLIESAVEECLRYDSPVQSVKRLASRDMEYRGQKLKKGDMLIVLLGACNRDPAVFKDPDNFDITRKENKHLAFSSGIHHCLGATLARIEGQIAINSILKRLPDLHLVEQKLEHKRPFNLRGLKQIQLEFSPRA
ncbi:MAG: cytochrome P450 [Candidatus Obscuribacterales bacterium]|nr:cytochrome P450 [Candidatus Obscuribacterales bacterium]